jgi:hypothetical protein
MAVLSRLPRVNIGAFAPGGGVAPVLQDVADTSNHVWAETRAIVLAYPTVRSRSFSFANSTGSTKSFVIHRATVRVPDGVGVLRLDARGQSVSGSCDILLIQEDGALQADFPLPGTTGAAGGTDATVAGTTRDVAVGVRVPDGASVRVDYAVVVWEPLTLP